MWPLSFKAVIVEVLCILVTDAKLRTPAAPAAAFRERSIALH